MFNNLYKKLTDDNKKVPLFYVTFDLNKYREAGAKGSCEMKLHPNFKGDESAVNQLNALVDYIRENYDMEDVCK
jgi:hypothetical protein